MEAGATALVMPRIRARDAEHLADLFHGGYAPLDYMFDADHLAAGLAAACPQLRVYPTLVDVPHVAAKAAREGLPDVEKSTYLLFFLSFPVFQGPFILFAAFGCASSTSQTQPLTAGTP